MAPLHLQQQCHHNIGIPFSQTLLYCLGLSSFFVLSLYALVPSAVRRLPRDHVLHIKWRAVATSVVMITGVGIYPLLFCERMDEGSFPPWYRFIGIGWQPLQDIQIALHVLMLYLGSLACTWVKIYHYGRVLHWEKKMNPNQRYCKSMHVSELPTIPHVQCLSLSFKRTWIKPTIQSFKSLYGDEEHRWTKLRNLAIAPLAEEFIFRACLLPPLLASRTKSSHGKLTPTQASWIAPLFFGVAHIHHFYEQYRQLPPKQRTRKRIGQLLLGLAVQFTYTTLFGAYVSHVFVRTGSLSGVVLAHAICNYMGLPDISFAHQTSPMHGYRYFVLIMYLLGIGLFAMGFNSVLFPEESVLPLLLQHKISAN